MPDQLLLDTLVADLQQQSGANAWYIFWNTRAPGAAASPRTSRPRTLVAFISPDAALAFAQLNAMSHNDKPPRLRRLALVQLIQALLREPAIETLLLANLDQEADRGQLPLGIVLSRAELLNRLNSE
jgi:hypothetical protein